MPLIKKNFPARKKKKKGGKISYFVVVGFQLPKNKKKQKGSVKKFLSPPLPHASRKKKIFLFSFYNITCCPPGPRRRSRGKYSKGRTELAFFQDRRGDDGGGGVYVSELCMYIYLYIYIICMGVRYRDVYLKRLLRCTEKKFFFTLREEGGGFFFLLPNKWKEVRTYVSIMWKWIWEWIE